MDHQRLGRHQSLVLQTTPQARQADRHNLALLVRSQRSKVRHHRHRNLTALHLFT
jgi:hypothetical protein